MSKVDEVSEKIKKMPLQDLLKMAAAAIDSCMDQKRLDFIFIHLETALQTRRIKNMYGLNQDE